MRGYQEGLDGPARIDASGLSGRSGTGRPPALFFAIDRQLESTTERKDLLKIISSGIANTAASLKLGVGAPGRFDSAIDLIAQSCATLRG